MQRLGQLPWRWCRGAFEGGSPLRKRLHWMRCIWTHLLQMHSGRCLGSVIASSFRASESDVRQFSWVRVDAAFLSGFGACSDGRLLLRKRLLWITFAWCWSLFRGWFAVAEAATLDADASWTHLLADAVWSLPWRWCRGAFEGGSPLRKRLHWMRCIWTHLLQMQSGRCLGSVITSSFRASESDVRQFSWVVWRCVFVWFLGRVLMVVYCCASGYIGCRCIWTHLLQMQSGRCLGGGVAVRSRVVRRCGSGYIG